MTRAQQAPIIRHAYAADPDPEKVCAALDLWRQALTRRLAAVQLAEPAPREPEGAQGGTK